MIRALAVLLLLPILGCATSSPGTVAATSADEAAIRELENQERLGVLGRDVEVLQRIWAEDFMVNSPMNTIAPNRAVVLDLVRQGMISYSSFERRIEQFRIDGTLAVVMGSETIQPATEPAAPPVQRRFTHIWRNESGSWRLTARHANNIAPREP
jgi:ketosteroid isomerase-like protein